MLYSKGNNHGANVCATVPPTPITSPGTKRVWGPAWAVGVFHHGGICGRHPCAPPANVYSLPRCFAVKGGGYTLV